MTALFHDVLRFAIGATPFSVGIWAGVTVLLLIVGAVMATVAPRLLDPAAVLAITDRRRVLLWMPLSAAIFALLIVFLIVTIIGAPLASIVVVALPIFGGIGYLGTALVLGDRVVVRWLQTSPPPWVAIVVGVSIFRIIRAIPVVGAPAHSLIAWYGLAVITALTWDVCLSWHRRRMPDAEQFAGETLIEWYPDGDPIDGRPSIGTGRPVQANIRGDEDRRPGWRERLRDGESLNADDDRDEP